MGGFFILIKNSIIMKIKSIKILTIICLTPLLSYSQTNSTIENSKVEKPQKNNKKVTVNAHQHGTHNT